MRILRASRTMEPVLRFPLFTHYFHQSMGNVTEIVRPKALEDGEITYMDACPRHVFLRLHENSMWLDPHGMHLQVLLILCMPATVPAARRVACTAS